MGFLLIIGLAGMIMILLAFILEDLNEIHRGGLYYNLLNLVGALLLTIYAIIRDDVIFIILNIFWIVIAIYFLLRSK